MGVANTAALWCYVTVLTWCGGFMAQVRVCYAVSRVPVDTPWWRKMSVSCRLKWQLYIAEQRSPRAKITGEIWLGGVFCALSFIREALQAAVGRDSMSYLPPLSKMKWLKEPDAFINCDLRLACEKYKGARVIHWHIHSSRGSSRTWQAQGRS